MITSFLLGFLATTGAYWFLRLVAWREDQAIARLNQVETLAPEAEASPHYRTILTLNNHTIEIGD